MHPLHLLGFRVGQKIEGARRSEHGGRAIGWKADGRAYENNYPSNEGS
jgi:hypothetical protein